MNPPRRTRKKAVLTRLDAPGPPAVLDDQVERSACRHHQAQVVGILAGVEGDDFDTGQPVPDPLREAIVLPVDEHGRPRRAGESCAPVEQIPEFEVAGDPFKRWCWRSAETE